MQAPLKEVRTAATLVAASVAGCEWWVVVVVALVMVFLHGAEPAMRWLDVIDRVRGGLPPGSTRKPRTRRGTSSRRASPRLGTRDPQLHPRGTEPAPRDGPTQPDRPPRTSGLPEATEGVDALAAAAPELRDQTLSANVLTIVRQAQGDDLAPADIQEVLADHNIHADLSAIRQALRRWADRHQLVKNGHRYHAGAADVVSGRNRPLAPPR